MLQENNPPTDDIMMPQEAVIDDGSSAPKDNYETLKKSLPEILYDLKDEITDLRNRAEAVRLAFLFGSLNYDRSSDGDGRSLRKVANDAHVSLAGVHNVLDTLYQGTLFSYQQIIQTNEEDVEDTAILANNNLKKRTVLSETSSVNEMLYQWVPGTTNEATVVDGDYFLKIKAKDWIREKNMPAGEGLAEFSRIVTQARMRAEKSLSRSVAELDLPEFPHEYIQDMAMQYFYQTCTSLIDGLAQEMEAFRRYVAEIDSQNGTITVEIEGLGEIMTGSLSAVNASMLKKESSELISKYTERVNNLIGSVANKVIDRVSQQFEAQWREMVQSAAMPVIKQTLRELKCELDEYTYVSEDDTAHSKKTKYQYADKNMESNTPEEEVALIDSFRIDGLMFPWMYGEVDEDDRLQVNVWTLDDGKRIGVVDGMTHQLRRVAETSFDQGNTGERLDPPFDILGDRGGRRFVEAVKKIAGGHERDMTSSGIDRKDDYPQPILSHKPKEPNATRIYLCVYQLNNFGDNSETAEQMRSAGIEKIVILVSAVTKKYQDEAMAHLSAK